MSFLRRVLTWSSSIEAVTGFLAFSMLWAAIRVFKLSVMRGLIKKKSVAVLTIIAAPATMATMIARTRKESGTSSMICVITHVKTAARKKMKGPH